MFDQPIHLRIINTGANWFYPLIICTVQQGGDWHKRHALVSQELFCRINAEISTKTKRNQSPHVHINSVEGDFNQWKMALWHIFGWLLESPADICNMLYHAPTATAAFIYLFIYNNSANYSVWSWSIKVHISESPYTYISTNQIALVGYNRFSQLTGFSSVPHFLCKWSCELVNLVNYE